MLALNVGLLIAGLVFAQRYHRPPVEREPTLTVVATRAPEQLRQGISAKVHLGQGETLRWSASGVVTAVHVAPGDLIAAGTVLADVDGVGRVACDGTPQYRALGAGAVGHDVDALRSCLTSMGLLSAAEPPGSALAPGTVGAVGALAAKLGVGGNVPVVATDPKWFAFSPRLGWKLGSLSIVLGQQVNGEEAGTGARPVQRVELDDEAERRAAALFPLLPPGSAAQLETGSRSVAVHTMDELLVKLGEASVDQGSRSAEVDAIDVSASLTVESVDRNLVVVPLAALGDGDQCVYRSGPNSASPVSVVVVAQIGQSAYLTGAAPDDVLLLAPSTLGDADCEHDLNMRR